MVDLCIYGHIIILHTNYTSHFMKNVKECRDINVKKVSEQGRDAVVTSHTLNPYHRTNRKSAMRSKECVLCSYLVLTLFSRLYPYISLYFS